MGTHWPKRRGLGGARRDRTADLLHAMQALSQLSYSPTREARNVGEGLEAVKKRSAHTTRGKHTQRPVADHDSANFRAADKRPSVVSRPSTSRVTSIGGETDVPETATRTGCATFPRPTPSAVAASFTAT
jgi:hypothetical protein